jgi:hypothetical protein
MIHFYVDLIAQTLKTVKEAYDCADVCNDITRIENAISQVRVYGNCGVAIQLDHELRQKYPCIDTMLEIASSISIQSSRITRTYSPNEIIIENLWQDYYGILCSTAIKKGFIHSTEEFIKSVD